MSDYDVLVIGSGFGGSVTALRLTEKGYRVGVLEAGRRFTDRDPAQDVLADVRSFLWAPRLGLHGIQRIHVLKDVVVLAGAGVGGGSLVYANTLYEPLAAVLRRPAVGRTSPTGATSWPRTTTRPSGCSASSTNPTDDAQSDDVMQRVAEQMGVGRHVPPDPGRRVLRPRRRAGAGRRRSPTRSSAARARAAPAASSAASA